MAHSYFIVFLILVTLLRTGPLCPGVEAQGREKPYFSNAEADIAFDYPANLVSIPCRAEEEPRCIAHLSQKQRRSAGSGCQLLLEGYEESFEQTAAAKGWARGDKVVPERPWAKKNWFPSTRCVPVEATKVVASKWHGLRGESCFGAEDDNGHYSSVEGTLYQAILTRDSSRSIVISARSLSKQSESCKAAFEIVLKSLRSTSVEKKKMENKPRQTDR